MKKNSFEAIRDAFKSALTIMERFQGLPGEQRWEFHRQSDGMWAGSLVLRASVTQLHPVHGFDKLASEIELALKQDYPEYLQLAGTALWAGALQPLTIPYRLVSEAHERYGTFRLTDEQINQLMVDVSSFFDRNVVSLRLCAPTLNLNGPQNTPQMIFPGSIILRPITDEECTRFYGGNPTYRVGQIPVGIPEFVFAKDVELPKIIGVKEEMKGVSALKAFQDGLDLCILALATFKEGGAVGYDGIRVAPSEFTLGGAFGTQGYFYNERVPHGRYELTREEVPKVEAHAKLFEGIHSTLEMASQRLVDSVRRTKARDGIVDAVIGLESILLANITEKTELRFRFSLRYASLFPKEGRGNEFRFARDLYDLRSKIAHGSRADESEKINGELMRLDNVAKLARSALRKTIGMFIANSKQPDFMQQDYWTPRELGLQDPTA